MAAGNTLTVRNARPDSRIFLLNMWADNQAAGALRVRSPRLHDNVQGIRFQVIASEVQPLLPYRFKQPLVSQDTLVVEHSGSATAGDIETGALLVWYEDLLGADARLISAGEVWDRGVDTVTVMNTLAAGNSGGYSGEEAINADFDNLKANTDYALVGYTLDTEVAVVRWRGADTANMGVGGPGSDTDRHLTRHWFLELSRSWDLPMVPVFNSANKGGFLLDVAKDENAATPIVQSILVELSPGGRR
jgi:hypothetical protein